MDKATVKELREKLLGLPDDTVVVLSRDAEGNGFNPLNLKHGVSFGYYEKEEFYNDGEVEDNPPPSLGALPCVVLWPW